MSLTQETPPMRTRAQRRDDDHLDVWWECTKGCPAFFSTPTARDEHEETCQSESLPWD